MSIVVSPVASEAASPMITSVTPTLELSLKEEEPGGSGSGEGQGPDCQRNYQKPPPMHTGADWKVVLHLPEIETWLRATAERVRDLTHSVHQDSLNKHVDVHLVQLKDICEDISDHVEQIHALLETEFSLKLLSYSVNIIVDIRSVQLLWHQLRVSVLVLKERLLQSLQDSNGNYTRHTDILQAFSQDHDQARLDALTEVDDSGQLTIKCSQDYFSLDCGITAYELSDYSPGEEAEGREPSQDPRTLYPELEQDLPELLRSVDLLTIAASLQNQDSSPPVGDSSIQTPVELCTDSDLTEASMQCGEGPAGLSKRPAQGAHSSTSSPTQPSLPKRPMFTAGQARLARTAALPYQADISRSTPSLLELPDRSKFWLELESVYPGSGSQSDENLHVMNRKNLQVNEQKPPGTSRAKIPLYRSTSEAAQEHRAGYSTPQPGLKDTQATGDSSSPAPSSGDDASDLDAHGSSSSPDNHPLPQEAALPAHSPRECWYGSEEYLALPTQLKQTELLALKLESLAQSLPPRALDQQPIQDVDDWELTEASSEWDGSPPPPPAQSYRKSQTGRRFSSSSSEVAASLDGSIESGPLSDLLSEDEGGWSSSECHRVEQRAGQPKACRMMLECTPLIQQLLEDIQHQENYQDVWGKIEAFVSKLDEFIGWLKEALESTENWTPPRTDADGLQSYLETHLSFKLTVDSHRALRDSLLEEGRQLLGLITSHKSGLHDILQMIVNQWWELQKQVRRQHGWMMRALDGVRANVLAIDDTHIPLKDEESRTPSSPQEQVLSCARDSQRDGVDGMRVKLHTQQYCSSLKNTGTFLTPKFNSLSEFKTEYQELWDWLMDMESTMTDSQELMMSEEQQQHLFKGNSVEMTVWLPKKMQLLGWAESLKRSGMELPADFEERITALRSKWEGLEKSLRECVQQEQAGAESRSLLSPVTCSMVGMLEKKVKELKAWLRDTELLIFNVNLRTDTQGPHQIQDSTRSPPEHQDLKHSPPPNREPYPQPDLQPDPEPGPEPDPRPKPDRNAQSDRQTAQQMENLKALCREVRARRKGMASVLRLCQHLLDGPEEQSSECERQSLRLLQVNLERRWEAIITQTLHWHHRLQRSLGRDRVPENLIDPSLVDLRGPNEDSWEWDEMDMSIIQMSQEEAIPHSEMHLEQEHVNMGEPSPSRPTTGVNTPESPHVYQVFSLHNVEMFQEPQYSPNASLSMGKTKAKQPLIKRLSQDSSFSSAESLPDIIAGLLSGKAGFVRESSRRSESESGIVSEGDTETTGNSDICLLYQSDDLRFQASLGPNAEEQSPCVDRVSDEDIDRILERAKKCAEMESCLAEETKDQRYHLVRRRREEGGERWRKHRKEPLEMCVSGHCLGPQKEGERHADGARALRMEREHLSQGSSLDSLYAAGELFPSSKDTLTRSTSLESWLAPRESVEEAGSQGSTVALAMSLEPSAELSGKTLELLQRLENIHMPLPHKLTRSVSDITLQGGTARALGHSLRSGATPPSANESSAASLTELSSIGDSSVASEDPAGQAKWREAPGAERKQRRALQQPDEAEASVSMVVNVSCTSACTDDEDDSDLLSSSTLTLTEEELGVKDEEDSSLSSEEYIESSFALGLDYMKGEFQGWNKPRSQNREKNEADLGDELQCGTLSKEIPSPRSRGGERPFLNRASLSLLEVNTNAQNGSVQTPGANGSRLDATRSYISRFVDDVENGNVDSSHMKEKDCDDDELLREEGSLVTKKGESFKGCSVTDALKADVRGLAMANSPSPCEPLSLQSTQSPLEGQLKGELPCHSSQRPSPALSPVDESAVPHCGALTSFLSDVHDGYEQNSSACCSCSSPPAEVEKSEDVHAFVMEIIDMTSVTRKTKEAPTEQPQEAPCPASVSQIREKVLEHSHRPIHLRKGDFYSYLSLSSHDSDCGEVVSCPEDKSSTPVLSRTPEIHDEEPLFEVCTEEVYLGPPLCYSMSISRRPTRRSTKLIDPFCPLSQAPPPACDEYQKAHGISPGSIAGSQPQSHNESPYLNPLPCETLIDTVECFADTKMLESNISPVMTKIRVSCSSTNPLKEEGSLYINPKINCPPIRKSDRDERGAASQWMKQKNVRKGRSSHQEAKATYKQVSGSQSAAAQVGTGSRRAPPPPLCTDSSSAVRSVERSRPQAKVPTRFSGSLVGPARK